MLDEISEAIGYTNTGVLAHWFAGSNLHIPQTARPDHPIASLIGQPAFEQLVAGFGGECLYIADTIADARIARYKRLLAASQGEGSLEAAAASVGLGVRRAQKILRALRAAGLDRFFMEKPEPTPGCQKSDGKA